MALQCTLDPLGGSVWWNDHGLTFYLDGLPPARPTSVEVASPRLAEAPTPRYNAERHRRR